MRVNIIAKLMAISLAWALEATALPSNGGDTTDLSLREVTTPDAALLGINCRGSSECRGYCNPDIYNMKTLVDQIDDNKEFSDGQQIACQECTNCPTCPDSDKRGICVLVQSLKKDEKVTAKVVKDSINALISHGCKKCGSCPVHPGNNVGDGQVTINFVRDFCKNGVCGTAGEAISARQYVSSPLPPIEPNCDGNSPGCDGGYCPTNITSIKSIVDTIDDDREFTDAGMIACNRCATQTERPADYRQGVCVFAKYLHKKTVTGKMLKESVDGIIKNGCGKCGGIGLNPSAGIPDGQIKIDFVRDACETGVCGQRPTDTLMEFARGIDIQKKSVAHLSITPRQDDPNIAAALLGINCRGSGHCNGACRREISQLKWYIDRIDTNKQFGDGEQIACVICQGNSDHGFCAYLQNIPGKTISGAEVQAKFADIMGHGCKVCGSAPLYPGNDVSQGQLTVNYSDYTCGEGICGTNNHREDASNDV